MKEVLIISSPVTERYVRAGMTGKLNDTETQIRVGDTWFDFDERWVVELLSITQAANKLQPTAALYQAKGSLFYPVFEDKAGHYLKEVEDDQYDSICWDCYGWAVAHFRMKRRAGHYKDIQNLSGIALHEGTGSESDDFVLCGHCGEYIETGVLHTFSQEIDHWLEVPDEDFTRQLSFPKDAWVMHQLMISSDATKRHPEKIKMLANRILTAFNQASKG